MAIYGTKIMRHDVPRNHEEHAAIVRIRKSIDFTWCCQRSGNIWISINSMCMLLEFRIERIEPCQTAIAKRQENSIELIRNDGKVVGRFSCGKNCISILPFSIICLNFRRHSTPGHWEDFGHFLDLREWTVESASIRWAACHINWEVLFVHRRQR
jgi:hypothetical protein